MRQQIETRELIALDVLDFSLQGTYHRPRDPRGPGPRVEEQDRLGVLFLFSIPRSAPGDSAVYWAESFAESGYPSFRFDMPGLGDSPGDVPGGLLDFINAGGYTALAAATVRELVQRFSLSGMVIVGHCSGAVSAIYTAAACGDCKGLVLMDPYFHLMQQGGASKLKRMLGRWASKNRLGGLLSDIHDRLKDARRLLRRNMPPENANRPLIRAWREVSSAGLPILLLKAPARKAPGTKARTGEFDYLAHVIDLAGDKGRVEVKLIEGGDHSFASRVGRTAVRSHAQDWLDTYFPQEIYQEAAVSA